MYNRKLQHEYQSLYERLIEFCLIFLIVFTPLAYGAVESWGIAVFEATAALMAIFWIFNMLKSGTLEFVWLPINTFILLFIFYVCLQLFFSRNTLFAIHYTLPSSIYSWSTKTELLKIISYAFIFFVALNTIKTRRKIIRILSIIITMGFLMSIFYLMRYLGVNVPRGIINPDHFAGYLGMIIPLALGLLFVPKLYTLQYEPTAKRFMLFFCVVVMSAALFFTMSRGGMFSFIIALLFMVALTSTRRAIKRKGWIISAVVIFIIFTITWLGATPVVERILSIRAEIASRYFGGRLPIWQGTLNIIKDYPVFGTGLGTFNYIFPKYQPAQIITRHYTYAHSDFLELLSEAGVAGFLLAISSLLLATVNIFKHFKQRHNPWVIGISIGLFGSLASIFIHSFTDFNLHIPANAILLTLILAAILIVLHFKEDKFGERVVFEKIYFRFSKISPVMENVPKKILLELFRLSLYPLVLVVFGFYISVVLRPALADCYLRNTQDTERNTQLAIKLDPSNAIYHYELAKLYSKRYTKTKGRQSLADLYSALSEYKKAIELNPINSKYRQSIAWIYGLFADLYKRNAHKEAGSAIKLAYREFQEAVALESNNPYRHRAYAIWLFSHPSKENIEKGISAYRKAIELEMGLTTEALDSYYQLTKNYDLLSRIIPDTAEGHFVLREYFLKNDLEKKALKEEEIILARLTTEISTAKNKKAAYEKAGGIYRGLGKFNEAIKMYHEAIKLGSHNSWTYYRLAESYRGAQMPDSAIKYFKISLQLDRSNSWPYFSLAELYQSMGKQAEARAMWQKILSLDNPDPDAKRIAKRELGEKK